MVRKPLWVTFKYLTNIDLLGKSSQTFEISQKGSYVIYTYYKAWYFAAIEWYCIRSHGLKHAITVNVLEARKLKPLKVQYEYFSSD
uniref:Uncharacterized protein n=1 Tax=Candidozyma auris TaxID=498019 RepID=A0A0L0P6C9_CANAR